MKVDYAVKQRIHFLKSFYFIWFQSSKDHHHYARGVMVIVVGNGHDDTSSNPGRD